MAAAMVKICNRRHSGVEGVQIFLLNEGQDPEVLDLVPATERGKSTPLL